MVAHPKRPLKQKASRNVMKCEVHHLNAILIIVTVARMKIIKMLSRNVNPMIW
jgi:hypothetical protein